MLQCVKQANNTLIWAFSVEEMFTRTFEYLQLVGNNGIVLNPKKFRF